MTTYAISFVGRSRSTPATGSERPPSSLGVLTPAPDEEDTMSINPVEDALDEMLAALKEGADPWTVPTLVGDAYKDQLRSDFTSLIKLWDSVRDRLKRMARHSGSLAGLVAQGAPSGGDP